MRYFFSAYIAVLALLYLTVHCATAAHYEVSRAACVLSDTMALPGVTGNLTLVKRSSGGVSVSGSVSGLTAGHHYRLVAFETGDVLDTQMFNSPPFFISSRGAVWNASQCEYRRDALRTGDLFNGTYVEADPQGRVSFTEWVDACVELDGEASILGRAIGLISANLSLSQSIEYSAPFTSASVTVDPALRRTQDEWLLVAPVGQCVVGKSDSETEETAQSQVGDQHFATEISCVLQPAWVPGAPLYATANPNNLTGVSGSVRAYVTPDTNNIQIEVALTGVPTVLHGTSTPIDTSRLRIYVTDAGDFSPGWQNRLHVFSRAPVVTGDATVSPGGVSLFQRRAGDFFALSSSLNSVVGRGFVLVYDTVNAQVPDHTTFTAGGGGSTLSAQVGSVLASCAVGAVYTLPPSSSPPATSQRIPSTAPLVVEAVADMRPVSGSSALNALFDNGASSHQGVSGYVRMSVRPPASSGLGGTSYFPSSTSTGSPGVSAHALGTQMFYYFAGLNPGQQYHISLLWAGSANAVNGTLVSRVQGAPVAPSAANRRADAVSRLRAYVAHWAGLGAYGSVGDDFSLSPFNDSFVPGALSAGQNVQANQHDFVATDFHRYHDWTVSQVAFEPVGRDFVFHGASIVNGLNRTFCHRRWRNETFPLDSLYDASPLLGGGLGATSFDESRLCYLHASEGTEKPWVGDGWWQRRSAVGALRSNMSLVADADGIARGSLWDPSLALNGLNSAIGRAVAISTAAAGGDSSLPSAQAQLLAVGTVRVARERPAYRKAPKVAKVLQAGCMVRSVADIANSYAVAGAVYMVRSAVGVDLVYNVSVVASRDLSLLSEDSVFGLRLAEVSGVGGEDLGEGAMTGVGVLRPSGSSNLGDLPEDLAVLSNVECQSFTPATGDSGLFWCSFAGNSSDSFLQLGEGANSALGRQIQLVETPSSGDSALLASCGVGVVEETYSVSFPVTGQAPENEYLITESSRYLVGDGASEPTINDCSCGLEGTVNNEDALSGDFQFHYAPYTYQPDEPGIEQEIRVDYAVVGLSDGQHGYHVHRFGDMIGVDGESMSGHFVGDTNNQRVPATLPQEIGLLNNGIPVNSEDGSSTGSYQDKLARLNGPNSIMGRGMIIHGTADNALERAAQCVIGITGDAPYNRTATLVEPPAAVASCRLVPTDLSALAAQHNLDPIVMGASADAASGVLGGGVVEMRVNGMGRLEGYLYYQGLGGYVPNTPSSRRYKIAVGRYGDVTQTDGSGMHSVFDGFTNFTAAEFDRYFDLAGLNVTGSGTLGLPDAAGLTEPGSSNAQNHMRPWVYSNPGWSRQASAALQRDTLGDLRQGGLLLNVSRNGTRFTPDSGAATAMQNLSSVFLHWEDRHGRFSGWNNLIGRSIMLVDTSLPSPDSYHSGWGVNGAVVAQCVVGMHETSDERFDLPALTAVGYPSSNLPANPVYTAPLVTRAVARLHPTNASFDAGSSRGGVGGWVWISKSGTDTSVRYLVYGLNASETYYMYAHTLGKVEPVDLSGVSYPTHGTADTLLRDTTFPLGAKVGGVGGRFVGCKGLRSGAIPNEVGILNNGAPLNVVSGGSSVARGTFSDSLVRLNGADSLVGRTVVISTASYDAATAAEVHANATAVGVVGVNEESFSLFDQPSPAVSQLHCGLTAMTGGGFADSDGMWTSANVDGESAGPVPATGWVKLHLTAKGLQYTYSLRGLGEGNYTISLLQSGDALRTVKTETAATSSLDTTHASSWLSAFERPAYAVAQHGFPVLMGGGAVSTQGTPRPGPLPDFLGVVSEDSVQRVNIMVGNDGTATGSFWDTDVASAADSAQWSGYVRSVGLGQGGLGLVGRTLLVHPSNRWTHSPFAQSPLALWTSAKPRASCVLGIAVDEMVADDCPFVNTSYVVPGKGVPGMQYISFQVKRDLAVVGDQDAYILQLRQDLAMACNMSVDRISNMTVEAGLQPIRTVVHFVVGTHTGNYVFPQYTAEQCKNGLNEQLANENSPIFDGVETRFADSSYAVTAETVQNCGDGVFLPTCPNNGGGGGASSSESEKTDWFDFANWNWDRVYRPVEFEFVFTVVVAVVVVTLLMCLVCSCGRRGGSSWGSGGSTVNDSKYYPVHRPSVSVASPDDLGNVLVDRKMDSLNAEAVEFDNLGVQGSSIDEPPALPPRE